MIEIYGLTQRGIRVARNPRNPRTPTYQVIAFLDKMPRASKDTIANYVFGGDLAQAGIVLRQLQANGLIAGEMGSPIR